MIGQLGKRFLYPLDLLLINHLALGLCFLTVAPIQILERLQRFLSPVMIDYQVPSNPIQIGAERCASFFISVQGFEGLQKNGLRQVFRIIRSSHAAIDK